MELWHCPTCDDVRPFEQPTCVDGHTEDGGECPDRACVDCGTALFVGDPVRTTAVARLRHAA